MSGYVCHVYSPDNYDVMEVISSACSGEIESMDTNDNTKTFDWFRTLLYGSVIATVHLEPQSPAVKTSIDSRRTDQGDPLRSSRPNLPNYRISIFLIASLMS